MCLYLWQYALLGCYDVLWLGGENFQASEAWPYIIAVILLRVCPSYCIMGVQQVML